MASVEIFSSTLMASLTSKDAIPKEIRDCILTDNKDRCSQIDTYIHSFRKNLHVKNGCVCIDDGLAKPNSTKDAYVEAIPATHPGTWGMTDGAVHALWLYMHRDIITKTAKCNPCVKIGPHRQVCPALSKKSNHCGLLNHFAKVCQKKIK